MSITLQYASRVTVVDTPSSAFAAANAAGLTLTGMDTAPPLLTGATTPTVTKETMFDQAMSAGAATVDLTSVAALGGGTQSLSGSKIRCLKVRAKSTNTAPVKVKIGASNGYDGFGSDFAVTLPAPVNGVSPPEVTIWDGGGAAAVGSTKKTLDLAGTGTDAVQFAVVAGG